MFENLREALDFQGLKLIVERGWDPKLRSYSRRDVEVVNNNRSVIMREGSVTALGFSFSYFGVVLRE